MEKRMLWEYRVIAVGSLLRGVKGEQIEVKLNELGLEGWEVVAAEWPHNTGKLVVIAKRPLSATERRQRRDWPSPSVEAK
jgi:hypothetical protein